MYPEKENDDGIWGGPPYRLPDTRTLARFAAVIVNIVVLVILIIGAATSTIIVTITIIAVLIIFMFIATTHHHHRVLLGTLEWEIKAEQQAITRCMNRIKNIRSELSRYIYRW